jgi:peptidoglycan/LPS O-acetylase OafA/YrhL
MFALGMLAAYIAQCPREPYATLRRKFPWAAVAVLGFAVPSALTVAWGVTTTVERFHILDLPVGLMAMSLLVLSSRSNESRLRDVFAWRPLAFVGTISYSFYLIHAPVLQLIWKYLLHPAGISPESMFLFYMTVGLGTAIGAAYSFFVVFEAPFLGKKSARVAAAMPAT